MLLSGTGSIYRRIRRDIPRGANPQAVEHNENNRIRASADADT
jgi:hypothetical protein